MTLLDVKWRLFNSTKIKYRIIKKHVYLFKYNYKKNIKDGFAKKFETNKNTSTFIVSQINTNTNEIKIEQFGIETRSASNAIITAFKIRLEDWFT